MKQDDLKKNGICSPVEFLAETASGEDIGKISPKTIASLIDHTILKPQATEENVKTICEEALKFGFCSVCINPYWIPTASKLLKESNVKICTVIGFPLGANSSAVKVLETSQAIKEGADEVDMVINVGALKSGDLNSVKNDIQGVAQVASDANVVSKVILETCLLSNEEIETACKIAQEAGADFVKTSTGFSSGGATVETISLMRKTVGNSMGVKASGGVRSLEDLVNMVKAGATRVGASSGVQIMKGKQSQSDY